MLNSKNQILQVLALSSSRSGNSGYLEKAAPLIENFLGKNTRRIAFVPFAAIDQYEAYFQKVQDALTHLGHSISMASPENAIDVISESNVIMVGGGNTFKLLHDIYDRQIFKLIQNKVNQGTPFIGWSAGSNITGLTIGTTNDMPIIEPASFTAFGFFPFQINPHYINQEAEGFHGETRDQRLAEFVQLNQNIPIIGLPEGTALVLKKGTLTFLGNTKAVLFKSDNIPQGWTKQQIDADADLSHLL